VEDALKRIYKQVFPIKIL